MPAPESIRNLPVKFLKAEISDGRIADFVGTEISESDVDLRGLLMGIGGDGDQGAHLVSFRECGHRVDESAVVCVEVQHEMVERCEVVAPEVESGGRLFQAQSGAFVFSGGVDQAEGGQVIGEGTGGVAIMSVQECCPNSRSRAVSLMQSVLLEELSGPSGSSEITGVVGLEDQTTAAVVAASSFEQNLTRILLRKGRVGFAFNFGMFPGHCLVTADPESVGKMENAGSKTMFIWFLQRKWEWALICSLVRSNGVGRWNVARELLASLQRVSQE